MRAVVLGGGYAGVVATTRLEAALPDDAEILLVDEDGHHLVQHELHRVVRTPAFADAIEVPLADVVDRATVLEATVEGIDAEECRIDLASGHTLSYDAAIVALGAVPAFYDIPGLRDHAIPLKRRAHAERIHAALADLAADGGGSVVVGGAGLAGVQAAGEIAAFASDREATIDVTLVEQQSGVVPAFDDGFRDAVNDRLVDAGVDVRTGVRVESASESTVDTAVGTLAADVLVWTGGIEGPAALAGERPTVRSDLALDHHTFVVGDAARAVDVDGEVATPSAQTAVGEATVAATNVVRVLTSDPSNFRPRLDRYDYDPNGWVVSVGDAAVAAVGGRVLTGRSAKALKSTVGLTYLASAGAIAESVGVFRREYGI
ncbi:MAG: NAD(P)/FAD-dependent oxidoreductase [Halanaeroarchaeum sp.]